MATKKPKKERRHDSIRIPNATLYKAGSIQGLKGNSCRLYLSYKDPEGVQRKKTRTYKSDTPTLTRDEAIDALKAWGMQLEAELQGKAYQPTAPTVSEYMGAYIEGRAHKIERRTVAEYKSLTNRFIDPALGAYQIDQLQPDLVQKWVNDCAKDYAPRTVRKALVLLRSAMKQAIERDLIAKDPTRTVEAPKVPTTNPNALGASERAKVLRFVAIEPADPMNMAVSMALLMGMRRGEICALRWRNVDLDAQTLEIREALGRDDTATGSEHWYIKEPKTGGSRRTLYIPDALIDPLRERLGAAKGEAAKFRADYLDYFVVGFADGSPMNGDQLTTKWRATAKALNLVGTQGKTPTFHDLRHTFATAAITNQSADIKTVSSMMGHSNAAMTLNIYASADPEAKRKASQSIAEQMQREVMEQSKGTEALQQIADLEGQQ